MWEWKDDDIEKIEEMCRRIGREHNTEIKYIRDKQSYEIEGDEHKDLDESRDELLKALNLMARSATQSLIIPRRSKKIKSKPAKVDLPPGLPPPLPFEKENVPTMTQEQEAEDTGLEDGVFKFNPRVKVSDFPEIFGWNRKEAFFTTCDYWNDICKECGVMGDIIEEKKKVVFNKGRERDVEEAIKRLAQLQENFLQPKFNHLHVPLVHYPNQYTLFKLYFCHILKHPYFSKTMKLDIKDFYVLVPATLDPLTQKYLLPQELPESTLLRSYDDNQFNRQWQENNENNREEKSTKGKAKAVSPNDDFYDSSSRNWGSISRPEETKWSQNAPNTKSMDAFPALSANRRSSNSGRPYPPENQRRPINESSLIDLDDEPPVIKRAIRQQNPNKNNYSGAENRPTIGKMVRDYNFAKMKDALLERLEYARVCKGEVRFFGSLGKAYFTKVNEVVNGKLWDYTELKDIIVSGHGVNPRFNEIATYDSNLISGFIDVLGSTPINKSKSAYYEIKAKARNAPQGPMSEVFMYVNMGFVSLEKVMLNWEPLVNIDWTILDRKVDFSAVLTSRRAIRHDVKPFSTFIKKISVSPNNRSISFEDVKDFLEVKSINFKQVTKFKLHYPFIAEVSRIERLEITDQPNSIKKIGKTGPKSRVHYTIEVYNDNHREAFKQNMSLGSGEIAKWTVDNILGESPHRNHLVELVKTMLLLVERCHKVAEIRSQQIVAETSEM
ncbi:hypothetical protein RhiirA4_393647 [Rhizophagus irregularis]|uniref:DUF7905 domain-containing protein n=1 Tax=Rhizophagus irregularis TaxID=588596 RepID=A0A2I1FYX6_9GLOM|nr:hypothetical protein RhiirA4_393647 [Rhizophagus irregularis]